MERSQLTLPTAAACAVLLLAYVVSNEQRRPRIYQSPAQFCTTHDQPARSPTRPP